MSLDIEGLDELESYLEQLPKRDAIKAVKKGLTPGMRQFVRAARAAAPVDTGRLRKAIKAKVANRKYLSRTEVAKDLYINPGKSRDDLRGSWYGYMVNSGYVRSNGTHVPGAHFMEAAYSKKANEAANIAQDKIMETLEKATDKYLQQ